MGEVGDLPTNPQKGMMNLGSGGCWWRFHYGLNQMPRMFNEQLPGLGVYLVVFIGCQALNLSLLALQLPPIILIRMSAIQRKVVP